MLCDVKGCRADAQTWMILVHYFFDDERENVPYLSVEDRKSESNLSTCLDSKTSGYAVEFLIVRLESSAARG